MSRRAPELKSDSDACGFAGFPNKGKPTVPKNAVDLTKLAGSTIFTAPDASSNDCANNIPCADEPAALCLPLSGHGMAHFHAEEDIKNARRMVTDLIDGVNDAC